MITNMRSFRKVNPMRFFVSLITLLSIVVHVTDSCSSTIGWKSALVEDEDIDRLITPPPHVTTLAPVMKTQRPTIMPHKTDEPCPPTIGPEFCSNDGKCFMLLHEPYCLCPDGWRGHRCMEKTLDGYYNVIVPKTAPTSTTTLASSTAVMDTSTESSVTTEVSADLNNVPVTKCPKQYDLEYCLNGGKCIMFQPGPSLMCLCEHPFVGLRCEEKNIEGDPKLRSKRTRRRVYNPNKKYPSYYRPKSTKPPSS